MNCQVDKILTEMLVFRPMKHWDLIREIAEDNYGIVTAAAAREICPSGVELARWVKKGWLERRGWGVYRLSRFTPSEYDRYAEAIALCGAGVVYGESVLALHNLALVNPGRVKVSVGSKMRRKLPDWVEVVPERVSSTAVYCGVPCQKIADAIIACKTTVPRDRLKQAVTDVEKSGLVFGAELKSLRKEMSR